MDSNTPVLVIDRLNRPAETWQRIADLAGAGKVTVVGGTAEGERVLAAENFGLILCSYRLSEDETGTEFISRMRNAGMSTPVIFIAELFDTKGNLEAAAIPMADFLAKPFAVDELKDRIRLLLAGSTAKA